MLTAGLPMRYRHIVIYVGRSSVFTDKRFTEKLTNTLHSHEEHGWELISVAPRPGALGDVSGIWMFFKRPIEADAEHPIESHGIGYAEERVA
jgi:hypothetical protein